MEDLSASLALSFQVTEYPNNPHAQHPRFSQYKIKNKTVNQDERRRRLLEQQKLARFNYVNHVRKLAEGDWALDQTDDDANDMEVVDGKDEIVDDDNDEAMQWTRTKIKKLPRTYKNQLMLSEWLVEVPCDLESQWYFVLCPVGRRCLVVTARSSTRAFAKNGYCVNSFPSHLPGGNRRQDQKGKEYTLLDCVYDEQNRTYYILDMMCWRGHPIFDSETEFRFYWLHEKIKEIPSLNESSPTNPFRFVPLNYTECSPLKLHETLNTPLPFSSQLDGILFYNKRTHYTHGPTPLVGWLKAYMVPELLKVDVSDSYMADKPAKYVGIEEHSKMVTWKLKKKKRSQENMICAE